MRLFRRSVAIGRFYILHGRRCFSSTARRLKIRALTDLPERITPSYNETKGNDLLSLQWPSPPRNILLVKKENTWQTTDALVEFAKHVHASYPSISFILEKSAAEDLHTHLPFPIYSTAPPISLNPSSQSSDQTTTDLLSSKVDLAATFGGDGTILRASSLFATSPSVPPILSFSMGTLGFLNEWKFSEYKRAFRELYMSGAPNSRHDILSVQDAKSSTPNSPSPSSSSTLWPTHLGTSLGPHRTARILLRNRLRVSITSASSTLLTPPTLHALNEILLHRGSSPHLTHLRLTLGSPPNERVLTTAVADGLIISTPTGSTAYSLSAGGSIIHPLVKGIVITPICARSLSFRPLVLPGEAEVGVTVDDVSRGGEGGIEVSIDGKGWAGGDGKDGVGVGMGVRVWGERVGRRRDLRRDGRGRDEGGVDLEGGDPDGWVGGVPCVMRGGGREGASGDEGWVGGLNGLLKFNSPFGEEV
ncbi:NADH kinase pos5 [Lecanora helva]